MIIGYLIAGIVLLGGITGFIAMERKAGGDAVRATLQPKIDKCEGELTKANDAAKAVQAEGERRIAAASAGVARARKEAAGAVSEAERLRGLAGGKAPASACPAASAVADIRKGLAK